MRWKVTPTRESDSQGSTDKRKRFDIGGDPFSPPENKPSPGGEPDAQKPSGDAFWQYSEEFCRLSEEALRKIVRDLEDAEFDGKVANQKKRIEEKTNSIQAEIIELAIMRILSASSAFGKESEKSLREKVLEAVATTWLTAKEVCVQIYPWETLSISERKRVLKATRMCLLRLCRGKRKYGLRKGKYVGGIELKGGIKYRCNIEGLKKLFLMREQQVKAENNEVLNEKMNEIMKLAEELVSEVGEMQRLNAQAAKKPSYLALAVDFFETSNAMDKTFAAQIVELQREIIQSGNDSRIITFIRGIKRLLEFGAYEVSLAYNLFLVRETQKIAEDQNARFLQIEKENMDRTLKELDEAIMKKYGNSPWRHLMKRPPRKRPGLFRSPKPSRTFIL